MYQKIELEAEQHAEHIHAAANPSNESAAETVGTARVLDELFYYQHGGRLGDLEPVTNRLLPFYGAKSTAEFQELFTQHLLIAADLVNAAKRQDVVKADDARKRWYQNADDIASFFSSINPFWNEQTWRSMLYSHLEMTEKEAVLRLGGNYLADIKIFHEIEEEALKMADYMFCGILKQHYRRIL